MQEYLFLIPFVVLGSTIIWMMVFLGTYPHFPRMEKQKRIALSAKNATVMTAVLMLIIVITLYILARVLIR